MDKQQKKALKAKYTTKQRQEFIDSLPFSVTMFHELFDYLDQYLQEHGCDDTLKATWAFLGKHNLRIEESLKWIRDKGDFCDCGVLANLEDSFENL